MCTYIYSSNDMELINEHGCEKASWDLQSISLTYWYVYSDKVFPTVSLAEETSEIAESATVLKVIPGEVPSVTEKQIENIWKWKCSQYRVWFPYETPEWF